MICSRFNEFTRIFKVRNKMKPFILEVKCLCGEDKCTCPIVKYIVKKVWSLGYQLIEGNQIRTSPGRKEDGSCQTITIALKLS